MKRSQKIVLISLLVCCLLLGLVGCGTTTLDSQTTSSPTSTEKVMETVVPTSDSSTEGAEVTPSMEVVAEGTMEPVDTATQIPATQMEKTEQNSVSDKLEVHYLDVGQGDCIFLRCGNQTMLIDAANNKDGTAIVQYLKNQGVSKLDYLIGTHPDADHIGGLDQVIKDLDIGKIYMTKKASTTKTYEDVLLAIAQKKYKVTAPKVGSTIYLGDSLITFYGPQKSYEDNNNSSIVIKLTHGDNSFLFMGDAEIDAEEDILDSKLNIDVDVLKVGHHGSNSSTTKEFVEAVTPEYAVISCGSGNKYGHPHMEAITRLEQNNATVLRTDLEQTIIITSDGKNLTIVKNQPSAEGKDSDNNTTTVETTSKPEVTPNKETPNKETQSVGKEQTYIGNKNSKKFHKSSCGSLPDEKNQVKFTSKEEAISQGYEGCKKCNP